MSDTFPALLRRYRERAGLSMEQLAWRCNVDRSAVSRWQDGSRHPTAASVVAIAEAFNLTAPDMDILLVSAGYLPRDPLSLVDDPLIRQAARLLADGNTAQQRILRRGLADALALAEGRIGYRVVGGGR